LGSQNNELVITNKGLRYLVSIIAALIVLAPIRMAPSVFAQSPEVSAEWALFNQILLIGIAVGLVVFGIMFYAIIRYREKPQRTGAA
jgi:heme/copper-type cytochrome/quinol oxidase subunit 2